MAHAYLIAGAGGMLGTALRRVLTERGERFVAPAESDFDITNETVVRVRVAAFAEGLSKTERGILLNAAAFTNVERAEDEPETAYRVNELGARLLAEAARDAGLRFVHVSTDFVFGGTKESAYVETDEPNPVSVYGASKAAGERAVLEVDPETLVVRTAWVFGPGGANFPVKFLAFAAEQDTLPAVSDEVGSPTYTIDLARGILDLTETDAAGIFHLVNAGSCTRYQMAEAILELAGLERTLVPISAADYPYKAKRPRNSVLDCSKAAALGVTMPSWESALERFLAEPQ